MSRSIFVETLNIEDDDEVNKIIEDKFSAWFDSYVHNAGNGTFDQGIIDIAWGPQRTVKTWPIYEVNGYKFHTEIWSEGKKTCNSGVCVKGNSHSDNEIYYYGVLEEIIQLQYVGGRAHNIFLFYCKWFDPTPNRGTRVIQPYNITEVKLSRRYGKFDPFIMANQAMQVYYLRYPGRIRDKIDWAVAVRTRPKAMIEAYTTVESAQQEESMLGLIISDAVTNGNESLVDPSNVFEEVSDGSDQDVAEELISSSSLDDSD